jgi:membrane-bound metal-dependent hydrolase YbcI (DUF457 family)
MRAPTHIAFSTLLYLVLLTSAGIALSFLNWAAVAAASLLPDLDTGASRVGRSVPMLSRWLERRFGHRTLTHSVVFIAGLAVVLLPFAWVNVELYICFLIGYASHPLIDSCTVTGVRLLYPVSQARCVFPMEMSSPMKYRIRTGSRQELVLAVVMVVVSIPALLVAYQGYERFVRRAQGTIESAVRDYNEISRTHEVWVDCRAHDLVTKETIEGRFLVAGAPDPFTLLIIGADERLLTLGREYRADYAVERAVCISGEEKRWSVHRIPVAKGDSVVLQIHVGDTVSAGEVIACIDPPAKKLPDREKLIARLETMRKRTNERVAAADLRIERWLDKLREDSVAAHVLFRAVGAGFAERSALDKRMRGVALRRKEVAAAVAGRWALMREFEHDSLDVALALRGEEAKRREVVVPLAGVLLGSVRRRGIKEDEFIYRIR